MPYIKQDRRGVFEPAIQLIVNHLGRVRNSDVVPVVNDAPYIDDENAAKGELNYVIYSIIKRYLDKHGMRYARAQDMIGGVLTCCQHELYRRLLGPYEDKAIDKNGDV